MAKDIEGDSEDLWVV